MAEEEPGEQPADVEAAPAEAEETEETSAAVPDESADASADAAALAGDGSADDATMSAVDGEQPAEADGEQPAEGAENEGVPPLSLGQEADEEQNDEDFEELDQDFDAEDEQDVLTDIDDTYADEDVYGKARYLQACEELGVVPVSQILKFLEHDTLQATHYGLGTRGALAVAQALEVNETITVVRFGDNNLGGEGAAALCDVVQRHHRVKELDLSRNDLRYKAGEIRKPKGGEDGEEVPNDGSASPTSQAIMGSGTPKLRSLSYRGGESLARLVQYSTITTLILSDNALGDKAVSLLADAIAHSMTLEILDLSRNELGELAGRKLGEMASVNSHLVQLDLSWNHLRVRGTAALCSGLVSSISLGVVMLGWNGLGDEGAAAVGDMLEGNDHIVELTLSGNGFTDVGFGHIARGLSVNKSLAAIALNQNMLPQVGEVGVKNEDGTVSSPNQAAQGTQHIVDAVNTNKGIVYVNMENTNAIQVEIEKMEGVLEERREKARAASAGG
ncbi:hypothetical protein NFJ02_28g66460 [Pycnococcus provasolii]